MKLLLFFNTLDRFEQELVIELRRRSTDLYIVCDPDPKCCEWLKDKGFRFDTVRCRSRIDLPAALAFRRVVTSFEPAVIHAFTSKTIAVTNLGLTAMQAAPKVVAYRGVMAGVNRFAPNDWLTLFHPRVAKIHCVSDAVKDSLIECGIDAAKLKRIYKGHRLDWYDEQTGETRSSLGIPDDAFVVACTANARPNKGVDVLLDAFKSFAPEDKIHLLLIGNMKGQEVESRLECLSESDMVHALGFRSDAAKLLALVDTFVMPTRFKEGLPRAVIEAMVKRVPPIVTAVGGMVELVRNGQDGLVVEPNNTNAIADAIQTLQSDEELRRTLGDSARARIEDAFNFDNSVTELVALYHELV